MFGYVTVNRPELKVKELDQYRSYYCGLCHALLERYGRRGQLLLSYDGTFLAILLTGLYEPKEQERKTRCMVHPLSEHREKSNRCIEYAADMNVMLAYRKAVDDWRDEKKQQAKILAMLLHKDYGRIRDQYPRQEKALAKNIRTLRQLEEQGKNTLTAGRAAEEGRPFEDRMYDILAEIEKTSACTGNFLAEMCVLQKDRWEKDLRETGFYLGKFTYLMDPYDDLDEDAKKDNFNVLSGLKKLDPEHFEEILKEILLDTAACCCRSFERLPIIQDAALLRNILYSGIWMRFHQIRSKEKEEKRRPSMCRDT